MAKKKTTKAEIKPQKEKSMEEMKEIKMLQNGRFQTSDGRIFDTLLKASNHLLTKKS